MLSSLKLLGKRLRLQLGKHLTIVYVSLILLILDKKVRLQFSWGSWAFWYHRMSLSFPSGRGGLKAVVLVTC